MRSPAEAHSYFVGSRFRVNLEIALPVEMVKTTARRERPQAKLGGLFRLKKPVVYHDRVQSMRHEDLFFGGYAAGVVAEDGERLQAELFLKAMPERIDAADILIAGKRISKAVNKEFFFQFGKKQGAACWRIERGGQQAVIAAGVAADNCRGGKSSPAIGLQPLLGSSLGEIPACPRVEVQHSSASSLTIRRRARGDNCTGFSAPSATLGLRSRLSCESSAPPKWDGYEG